MLTQERLKELLEYDPETGVFVWKITRRGKAKAGARAGAINNNGYEHIWIDQIAYKSHRLAWLYVNGSWPARAIDHINRIKSDNRITNLREATKAQNGWNRGKNSNNTSGYPGVSWHKTVGKWSARIRIDSARKHLGYFDTPEEANAAYVRAKAEHHKF